MKTLAERNYAYHAAGKVWRVPLLRLTRLPDGSVGISDDEIRRVHRAVANALCGSRDALSFDEFEFLCDTGEVSFTDVARHLGLHKSTLSKWRQAGTVPPGLTSLALKRYFWFLLFGSELGGKQITLSQVQDEAAFLEMAHDQAIKEHAADPIERMTA